MEPRLHMRQAARAAAENCLYCLVLPAVWALAGYGIESRWPDSPHTAFWVVGAALTGCVYFIIIFVPFGTVLLDRRTQQSRKLKI